MQLKLLVFPHQMLVDFSSRTLACRGGPMDQATEEASSGGIIAAVSCVVSADIPWHSTAVLFLKRHINTALYETRRPTECASKREREGEGLTVVPGHTFGCKLLQKVLLQK